jgi:alpha-tubulin suppressor-like RCC1 family protein
MANTNFQISGADLTSYFVPKEYVIDRYAELPDVFKTPTLWGWGYNSYGQLGTNELTFAYYSPVQTISAGTNWKEISSGSFHTTAIKTDGTLWMWGRNNNGQLGDNTVTNKSSPIQTVAGGTNWKQISCSGHNLAIKTDGTLWTWGVNGNGQLGDNTIVSKSSPVQTVAGGTNWKQVGRLGSSSLHAGAIKTDGTLWMWGDNSSYQLGDGTSVSTSSPVQTVAGGTNWKQVSCGYVHTAAIKTDGTLWTWGSRYNGALGDNFSGVSFKSSPAQTIAGGINWKQIHCGQDINSAIKTDGTLWVWGYNPNGALGTNNITSYSSPVQTVAGGTNWKQVECGSFAMAAIKSDGTLWLWGSTVTFGAAETPTKSSPVQTIAGGNNWKQVTVDSYNTYAIRDDSSDIYGDPY